MRKHELKPCKISREQDRSNSRSPEKYINGKKKKRNIDIDIKHQGEEIEKCTEERIRQLQ